MLYQQGTQRIEVVVKKEGSVGVAGAKEVDTDNTQPSGKETRESLRRKRILVTNATHTLAAMKQIGGMAIEYVIGGIGYANGDQSLQSQISRNIEKIEDVTNIASAVSMGMIFGAWGGPVGIVAGGVLAAATTGSSLASKYANRERDYNYKVFKENNAIEYNRARASINFTSGRLR